MRLLFGIVAVFLSVLGGFVAMGGRLGVLWQPVEIVIIIGAGIGGYVIANAPPVLRGTLRTIGAVARGRRTSKDEYLELIALLYALLRQAKSKGMSHIEGDIDKPEDSPIFAQHPSVFRQPRCVAFLCDYLRLIALGQDNPHDLEALMSEEIETIARELNQVPKALQNLADALPALGIVAAVLGVINAMSAISEPPEVLGHMIGGALTGTFLGVLLSYGLVGPIAAAARHRREAELTLFICVKAGIGAYLRGSPPQVCAEFARKVLFADTQPSLAEVEVATTLSSQAKAREANQPA
ncbi:flagellar motor stator protein MotA [Azospirillum rugosum]|uniref:Chemotaxis protein MotA n=1 Tax=Azospirillum rugosum TaxID=416170 RepID=A0ABS4SUB5_9PROT|nr:flagellar motor stator protein MotA [Azospirillum rugosum]MBP2296022.1 chemotaxis protein MotA [Azospirillum rugosum]MDQ0529612.1 chemotaxis protein MotA [Azospirillum rugosum]